jgi:hypothetical protein
VVALVVNNVEPEQRHGLMSAIRLAQQIHRIGVRWGYTFHRGVIDSAKATSAARRKIGRAGSDWKYPIALDSIPGRYAWLDFATRRTACE